MDKEYLFNLEAFCKYPFKFEDGYLLFNINKRKITFNVTKGIGGSNYDSEHFERLIKFKNINWQNAEEFANFIIYFAKNLTKICTVCGKRLEYPSAIISHCLSEECSIKSDSYVMDDNLVVNYARRDLITLKFLMKVAYAALQDPRVDLIFLRKRKEYYASDKVVSRDFSFDRIDPPKDIKKLKNDLKKLIKDTKFKFYDKILKASNDRQVSYYLGRKLYNFTRFVLKSNKTDLISTPFQYQVNFKNGNTIINKLECDKNVNLLSVSYPKEVEKKFNIPNPEYFFHGSPLGNWFSILRNGIKNCSKSKLMANGAAGGSGVYGADNISTPLVYARGGCEGVLQVIKGKNNWKKKLM